MYSETAADVQLSINQLSNLTKRKSPWRLKTHWDPCDRSATPCIEISSVFSEIPASDSARPSQVADRRRSQEFSLTFIRYLSLVKAKISIATRRGYRAGKIFVGTRLFCPQEEEKTKREVLGQMRQTTLTGEVAPQGPRGRGIPQGCGHFVNSPHCTNVQSCQFLNLPFVLDFGNRNVSLSSRRSKAPRHRPKMHLVHRIVKKNS